MSEAYLEHMNITVRDPDKTAEQLVSLFGWQVRWAGESIYGGRSVHVGGEQSYLALYSKSPTPKNSVDSYSHLLGLNHLGIVVDDLDKAEKKILDAGFETQSHADYEPGRRFYFEANDGLHIEVISYC